VTALTEPQRAAIRDGVAGLERDEIVFLVTTEGDENEIGTLHLARHMSNEVLITVGRVTSEEQVIQLAAYVSEYLAELYPVEGED
jgi:hypothetical protein